MCAKFVINRPRHTCKIPTGPTGPVEVKLDWPKKKRNAEHCGAKRHDAAKPRWGECRRGDPSRRGGYGGSPPENFENYKQFGEFWCISALQ